MARAGKTWKVYSQLLSQVAAHYGQTLTVTVAPDTSEDNLLIKFSADLKARNTEATLLLEAAGIGEKQYRYHLRYIARWSAERRRLLADGGNFGLLENRKLDDQQLLGLKLSGSAQAQRRQLAEHVQQDAPAFQGVGWLPPTPGQGRRIRVYDERQVVWIYSPSEVMSFEGLHGSVARSLINRYVPSPGIVADPMSGGGVIARMASEMGHWAWASDIAPDPRQPYIASLNLLTTDLGKVIGEKHQTMADLVALHPPSPRSLGLTGSRYETWLVNVLKHSWGAVKFGGHLALIVPIQSDFDVLSAAERALLDSIEKALVVPVLKLAARHIAATQSGDQGWHILVCQRPEYTEGDE